MNYQQALELLNTMLWAAQKARSNLLEQYGGSDVVGPFTECILQSLEPWLFGPRCIIEPLSNAISQSEQSKQIEGLTLYNLMHIAELTTTLQACLVAHNTDLSAPDRAWIGKVFQAEEQQQEAEEQQPVILYACSRLTQRKKRPRS